MSRPPTQPEPAGAAALADEALALALRLAREAGELATAAVAAGAVEVRAKGARGDVVTPVDEAAEALIVAGIRAAFPDHEIRSEEAGRLGGPSPFSWLVDPLDGTNNVALGLRLHGVCIALRHAGEPFVAVVRDAARGRSFAAVRGRGASEDGRPLRLASAQPPARTTVSWLQGYGVAPGDARAEAVRGVLGRTFKRTLATWAPSVDWGLVASGGVGAVVAYRNELEDLVGGLLLVREAGGAVCDFHGRPLAPGDACDEVVAGNTETVTAVVESLSLGLTGLASDA